MCVKALMKIVSGVLSIVSVLLGVIFLIVGFILQFGLTTVVVNYLRTYINELNNYLKATGSSVDIETYIQQLPQITGNLAVTFIIMGIVIAAVGVIGLVAVCCEVKVMLIIYIVLLGILIAGQVTLIIVYYAARDTFISRAKTYMQDTINNKYSGYSNMNMETILWNVFHTSLGCCGITNGTDFASAKLWTRNVTYNSVSYTNIAYPLTCCRTSNYTGCLQSNHTSIQYTNLNVGCWEKIDTTVQTNITYAALGTAAIVLLQTLILVFAVHLCKGDSSKTQPV
ncbi:hypothetical protein BOX15_Mlig003371g1 [Macrostomum lignano]|uniref:Tetraspanin n=2 Tax=Macrostomum lignano TaxID=282301 RepID=A0A1I8GVT5_9PLAT|nr:hypothetical protein BOX15_Mlig013641g1 [Macrostomum lignano]PAA81896.1 hypothetical protein BOX15_Mlig003371g1 [Macrostomum lignano]